MVEYAAGIRNRDMETAQGEFVKCVAEKEAITSLDIFLVKHIQLGMSARG